MNILRTLMDFLSDDTQSMRLNAAEKRVREQMGDVRYLTIADSKSIQLLGRGITL